MAVQKPFAQVQKIMHSCIPEAIQICKYQRFILIDETELGLANVEALLKTVVLLFPRTMDAPGLFKNYCLKKHFKRMVEH